MMTDFSKTPGAGFTLIESLVAVSILTFAVAGPLFAASRAYTAVENARNQLTASYLAQEGAEYVRLMRDIEYLAAYQAGGENVSSTAWNNFLSGGGAASIQSCRTSTCTLDPSRNMGTGSGLSLVPCSGASCGPLYLAPSGIYTQQTTIIGASQTLFTRTVQAITVSATEARVDARVSWSFRGTPYSVTVSDHLSSWQ